MPTDFEVSAAARTRQRISLAGCVQGVGFRPFVYRLAREFRLGGSVWNTAQGIVIEVEGAQEDLNRFVAQLRDNAPAHARIDHFEMVTHKALGVYEFTIAESAAKGRPGGALPDLATCAECLNDVLDPQNRRYRYPFTNCTYCGPRYSILARVPYDRANTAMARFVMCQACAAEYRDPADRRFHAQPNACPACGPLLECWDERGQSLALHNDALARATEAIRAGQIVAVKGIGGFHLFADARNTTAVRRLRMRKQRDEKPFAVMFPTLEAVRAECAVSQLEEQLLSSAAAPIVLLRRHPHATLPDVIAPRNPNLGVVLAYSPLHHLFLRDLDFPVVATSGNVAGEPICTDEHEAVRRLSGIADCFLVHNRPILRAVDDSIVRVVADRELMLRCARGYAPLSIRVGRELPELSAFGAQLKNCIALSRGTEVLLSQHIGDLETLEARAALETTAQQLPQLFEHRATRTVADLHPDYASTREAARTDEPIRVQHHYAHVLACMAENGLAAPVLGVAWDGVGLGSDGSIWGGEFLRIDPKGYERVAHLRPFRLPGGDAAAREPRRSAIGILYEIFGPEIFERTDLAAVAAFSPVERAQLKVMLTRQLNTPRTTSTGRLCDAVAALIGLTHRSAYEGHAAMLLEFAIQDHATGDAYEFPLRDSWVDWEPALRQVLADLRAGVTHAALAAKFHNGLAETIVAVAQHSGERRVALSGGCFQNKYLLERTVVRLIESGFQPYWHRRVPPNDGGIALGQIMAAARILET